VLGNKVKATDPMWAGLDLNRADLLCQSSLAIACFGPDGAPPDMHLSVPWCHPEDQTGSPDDFDCWYRVRPRMEVGKKWKGKRVAGVCFELYGGKWFLAIETIK
jgi:hypothetical protein